MARYLESKCKLCRRDGERLYLKGARCHTVKCAVSKRTYPPGMHGMRRSRHSDYGLRLRETQKVKRLYGVSQRQFRNFFAEASRLPGNTGEMLLLLLERRLDNAVCKLGFASGRVEARQLIQHGHITVNGRKVDIVSYLVKPGMKIAASHRKVSQKIVRERLEARKADAVPTWLALDAGALSGGVVRMPAREDISLHVNESYIVEFCSR
ncbi:MAG: 30S ribosomal protein S4 [Planctomycetes bacterium]|nr:30S ribosomal protein S4 [Planctomycetota bacterium]